MSSEQDTASNGDAAFTRFLERSQEPRPSAEVLAFARAACYVGYAEGVAHGRAEILEEFLADQQRAEDFSLQLRNEHALDGDRG